MVGALGRDLMGGEVGWEEVRKIIRGKHNGVINKRGEMSALASFLLKNSFKTCWGFLYALSHQQERGSHHDCQP